MGSRLKTPQGKIAVQILGATRCPDALNQQAEQDQTEGFC